MLFGLVVPAQAVQSGPAGETAAQLLDRAFQNLYADDYIQTMTLAARTRGSNEMTKQLQIIRKQSQQPGKALVRFLKPSSIRRTSVLILESEDARDDLYIYLPALRRTKHLSNSQRADSFFGTDLSYEDVEPKHGEDYDANFVATEDLDPDGCVRVEFRGRAGIESTYDYMVSCIHSDDAVIEWTQFYRGGKQIKRLDIDRGDVRKVGSRWIPFSMTMSTDGGRSETRVLTESYELREDISDRIFTTWNLEAGDAKRDLSQASSD